MGRRQTFLLLLLLCVFASVVSAQSASVSFVRPRDGRTADFALAESAIVVRVVDVSYNLDPAAVETLPVSISLLVSEDSEAVSLKETGPDTGVFEGSIRHFTDFPSSMGDGLLASGTATFQPDTVRVQHEAPTFADAQVPLIASVTRLVDENGAQAESFALGSELRVEVETASGTSPSRDVKTVEVRSLATGDLELLRVWETDTYSLLFTRALPIVPGAAVPGDGRLQAQPGETVEVEHEAGGAASSDQAAVVRSAVRFVDAAGLPVSVLVEEGTARVRVLDPLSAGQAPPAATIRSRITLDVEPLSLAELPGSPGLFEGSIPLRLGNGSGGVLGTGRESSGEPDTITAGDGQAAASLPIVPALLEILDDRGRPRTSASAGDTLRIRATVLRPDPDAVPGYVMVLVSSLERGHSQFVFLPETGASTGIFEGTVPAVLPGDPGPSPVVFVETTDTVEVSYNDSTYPADPNGRAETAIAIVPVAVELLDEEGEAAESYLYGDAVHVRVVERDANADPAAAETVTAAVIARRYGDANHDLETATLLETGPDTGVFTGTLPTFGLLGYSEIPVVGNGLVELPAFSREPDSESMLTAHRSGASATARVRDAELWLADEEGRDAEAFPVGSPVHVWLRRPASNASSGIDAHVVGIRTLAGSPDSESLVLLETGADSGLFTASILVQQGPPAQGNGVLTGQIGDAFEAWHHIDFVPVSSDLGYLDGPQEPPVNQPPHANDDFPSTYEETPVNHIVLANDVDPEGDPLTLTAVTQGANGSVAIEGDGSVTYTPNEGFSGSDTFTYTVSAEGGTDTGTVHVTVYETNDPPDAADDAVTTNEDMQVNFPVKNNDSDPDGDTLSVASVTQGTKGSVVINQSPGAFHWLIYTPNANANGTDTFTYTISDNRGGTDTATVTVTITPVNDTPRAFADQVTTAEDTPLTFDPRINDTDPDGDALTVTSASDPNRGSTVVNPGGTITYTPDANLSGTDSFVYSISDGNGGTWSALVNVTVTPVNDPPLAGPDSAATNENTPVTVSVLANDADVDGGALSVSAVTQGTNGAVTTNGITVTYTPAAGFSGSDSFTYNVSDGLGGTATGLVTVTVAAVNGAPVANPDSGTTREDVAVILAVLANDTDADGDTLTVTAVGSPGVLLPDDTVRYTPGANFTGTVTFGYTVSDGQGGTADGQVTVAVGEALERVAILATNSVALRTGSDVLSGDVIVNQAGAGPFLNGAELSIASLATTAANWDVEADSVTVGLGATVASDVAHNQLTNLGAITGQQRSPLALPVFPALPAFLTATPGTTNINVGTNGTRTLAPGSYLDLVVGRKGTVTFTGGVYHFRSITVDREAKLLFSAASEVRVQQKLGTKNLTTVGPAAGASIDASSILFYVAGINGTTGALSATPKAVEIGTNNTVEINLYAPNGTARLQDGTAATGAFLGKDIDVGLNVQVTLDSAF